MNPCESWENRWFQAWKLELRRVSWASRVRGPYKPRAVLALNDGPTKVGVLHPEQDQQKKSTESLNFYNFYYWDGHENHPKGGHKVLILAAMTCLKLPFALPPISSICSLASFPTPRLLPPGMISCPAWHELFCTTLIRLANGTQQPLTAGKDVALLGTKKTKSRFRWVWK